MFRSMDDPGLAPDEQFQEVLLGPIVDRPNGLRVEGGSVCGGLCGHGAVYIVVATENGYKVTGTDERYGEWVSPNEPRARPTQVDVRSRRVTGVTVVGVLGQLGVVTATKSPSRSSAVLGTPKFPWRDPAPWVDLDAAVPSG